MSYMPYVEFENGDYVGHHITRVGCMLCNDTIASKDPQTGQLYFWTHKRDIKVQLSDGSAALVPVCDSCVNTPLTNGVLSHLDNTIKHGWMVEQVWAFKKYPQRTTKHILTVGQFSKQICVLKGRN